MGGTVNNYPVIEDPDLRNRIEENRRRRFMLTGLWRPLLAQYIRGAVGETRASTWPEPNINKCVAKDVWWQKCVLYKQEPTVAGPTLQPMIDLLKKSQLWPSMPYHQRMVEAQREALMRVDIATDGSRLMFRTVPADMFDAEPLEDDPRNPGMIRELRERVLDGETVWAYDVFDIRDPNKPIFRVEDESGKDLSGPILGGFFSEEAYPFRWTQGERAGQPYIPGELYHASFHPGLFDPYFGIELVEGTLKTGQRWTQWDHLFQDNSWPQRVAIDLVPIGASVSDDEPGVATLEMDRGHILMLRNKFPGGNGRVETLESGGDAATLAQAIRDGVHDIISSWGFAAADVQRVSADPRSGYAISLKRSAIRDAQQESMPFFKESDERLLGIAAAVWNNLGDGDLAEEGWTVTHRGVPLSAEEKAGLREEFDFELQRGITSKVEYLMTTRGLTEEQAIAQLRRVQQHNAMVDAPQEEPEEEEPEEESQDD